MIEVKIIYFKYRFINFLIIAYYVYKMPLYFKIHLLFHSIIDSTCSIPISYEATSVSGSWPNQ